MDFALPWSTMCKSQTLLYVSEDKCFSFYCILLDLCLCLIMILNYFCLIITGSTTHLSNQDNQKAERHLSPHTCEHETQHGFVNEQTNCIQTKNRKTVLQNFPSVERSGDYLNDLVILTTITSSFIDLTENWLASIRRCGEYHPRIYIIAEDQETYDHFYNKSSIISNVNVIKAPQYEETASQEFNTGENKNLLCKRPQYILDILKSGHDVLFSDVDVVWFHRPYRFFNDDFDILFLQDQVPPDTTVSTGFAFYRATNDTIQFVERWVDEIKCWKEPKSDQVILNRLVIKHMGDIMDPIPWFKLKILNPKKFVSGKNYFNEIWRKENPNVKPVVLHNNWIQGHDAKVERFKKLRTWFVWL